MRSLLQFGHALLPHRIFHLSTKRPSDGPGQGSCGFRSRSEGLRWACAGDSDENLRDLRSILSRQILHIPIIDVVTRLGFKQDRYHDLVPWRSDVTYGLTFPV